MYLSCGVLRHILYMQREKPVSLLLDVKHICSPSYGVRLVVPYLVLAWWQRQLCCAINNHLSILPASGMGGCLWDVVHAWFDCIETQRPCNHKCSWENILSLYSLLNCYSPLTEWVILLQSAIKSIIYYIPLFRASELWSRTHAHTHTCTHTHAHTHTHTHTQPHFPPVQRAGGCSHWEACRIKCRPLNPHAFEQCQKQRKQLQDP